MCVGVAAFDENDEVLIQDTLEAYILSLDDDYGRRRSLLTVFSDEMSLVCTCTL
jgi:hypothetical protein